MEQRFKLKLKNPHHYWMKGIYKITIGGKFYIGKALNVGMRAYQHELEINTALKNYSRLMNIGPDGREEMSKMGYLNIARYIHENPSITGGTVEVLQRQVCSNMMYFSENMYLKEIEFNRDSYNISVIGSRPKSTEDNLWQAELNGECVEYFDPRLPQFRLKSTTNNNQNKKILEQIKDAKNQRPYKMQRIEEERVRLLGDNPSLERRKAVVEYIIRKMQTI